MSSYYFTWDPFDIFDDFFYDWPRQARRRGQMSLQQREGGNNDSGRAGKQNGTSSALATPSSTTVPAMIAPRMDFKELPDRYVITAEVAGVPREQIKLELHGDLLTVRGEKKEEHTEEEKDKQGRVVYHRTERAFGSFERSVKLPKNIDKQSVHAACKDGVLTVTVNKAKKDEDERMAIEVAEA